MVEMRGHSKSRITAKRGRKVKTRKHFVNDKEYQEFLMKKHKMKEHEMKRKKR